MTKYAHTNGHTFQAGDGTSAELHLAGRIAAVVALWMHCPTEDLFIAGPDHFGADYGHAAICYSGMEWAYDLTQSGHADGLRKFGFEIHVHNSEVLIIQNIR